MTNQSAMKFRGLNDMTKFHFINRHRPFSGYLNYNLVYNIPKVEKNKQTPGEKYLFTELKEETSLYIS